MGLISTSSNAAGQTRCCDPRALASAWDELDWQRQRIDVVLALQKSLTLCADLTMFDLGSIAIIIPCVTYVSTQCKCN